MFRIAIVDDESCVRMGLKTIAEKEGLYTVVGEADNGASAVQMIMQKQPDAVFLDITIPGLDGMEVLKEIRQRGYSGHVTMLDGRTLASSPLIVTEGVQERDYAYEVDRFLELWPLSSATEQRSFAETP